MLSTPFAKYELLLIPIATKLTFFFGECNYTFKNTLYSVLYYSITMPGFPALNRPSVLLLLFTQLFILFLLCFFSPYRYLLSWYSLFFLSFPLYTTSCTIIFVPKKVLKQFNKLNENYINCVTGFIFSCSTFALSFSKPEEFQYLKETFETRTKIRAFCTNDSSTYSSNLKRFPNGRKKRSNRKWLEDCQRIDKSKLDAESSFPFLKYFFFNLDFFCWILIKSTKRYRDESQRERFPNCTTSPLHVYDDKTALNRYEGIEKSEVFRWDAIRLVVAFSREHSSLSRLSAVRFVLRWNANVP